MCFSRFAKTILLFILLVSDQERIQALQISESLCGETKEKKEEFLNWVLKDQLKEFEYGYQSRAHWEEHFQCSFADRLRVVDFNIEVKREVSSSDDKGTLVRPDIVLIINPKGNESKTSNKITIEIKVENYKDTKDTMKKNVKRDYDKLVKLKKKEEENTKFYFLAILRSNDALLVVQNALKIKIKEREDCLFAVEVEVEENNISYAAILVDLQCDAKMEVKYNNITKKKSIDKDIPPCRKQKYFASIMEKAAFIPKLFELLGSEKEFEWYKTRMDRKVRWEDALQVLISKLLQCDFQMGYGKELLSVPELPTIREVHGYRDNGKSVDFYIHPYEVGEKYAIELKVDNGKNKFGGQSLENALNDDAKKLLEWVGPSPTENDRVSWNMEEQDTNLNRFLLIVMRNDRANCKIMKKWLLGERDNVENCGSGIPEGVEKLEGVKKSVWFPSGKYTPPSSKRPKGDGGNHKCTFEPEGHFRRNEEGDVVIAILDMNNVVCQEMEKHDIEQEYKKSKF